MQLQCIHDCVAATSRAHNPSGWSCTKWFVSSHVAHIYLLMLWYAGTVFIPACKSYPFQVRGIEIETDNDRPGVDFQCVLQFILLRPGYAMTYMCGVGTLGSRIQHCTTSRTCPYVHSTWIGGCRCCSLTLLGEGITSSSHRALGTRSRTQGSSSFWRTLRTAHRFVAHNCPRGINVTHVVPNPPQDTHNFLRDWNWEGNKAPNYPDGWDTRPVTWVSLEDARNACSWAGGRLPQEWEWQYAAQVRSTGFVSERPCFTDCVHAASCTPALTDAVSGSVGHDTVPLGRYLGRNQGPESRHWKNIAWAGPGGLPSEGC